MGKVSVADRTAAERYLSKLLRWVTKQAMQVTAAVHGGKSVSEGKPRAKPVTEDHN